MARRVGMPAARNHWTMVSPSYNFRLMRRPARAATFLRRMTRTMHDTSIEPLFAQNARLWLRVWLATQLVATLVATSVEIERHGARLMLVGMLVVLAMYHVAGVVAHTWILRRT